VEKDPVAAEHTSGSMGRNSLPCVSVIVPCYNSEATVRETLDSVLAQSFEDWEAVIVNDASTDGSVAILASYGQKDSRFRLLCHEENRGLAATRNTGIRAARGTYLNFLDADDMLAPGALATMVSTAQQRPECAGVYSGWTIVHASGEKVAIKPAEESALTLRTICHANKIQVPALIVKACALTQSGLFDESMRRCEDWDLWIRLHRAGHKFARVGEPLAFYRDNSSGLSHVHFAQWQSACRVIELSHSRDDRCPGVLPEHADGPGPVSKAAALKHADTNALRFSLARGDAEGAKCIAESIARLGLPAPEPELLVYALLYSLRYYPGLYTRMSDGWPVFRKTLDEVLPRLGSASANRWYARDFLSALLLRLPDHVDKKPLLRSCVRHGILLKPVRTFRAIRAAYGRRG